MADEYTIEVEHDGRSYRAGVHADQELDQLLLKSLDYFDLDPDTKDDWTLVRVPRERRPEEEALTLGREVSEELRNGDRVRLLPRNADREEQSTGSY